MLKHVSTLLAAGMLAFAAPAARAQTAAPPSAAPSAIPLTAELKPGVVAKVVSLKPVPGQKMVQLDYEITNQSGAAVDLGDLGIGGGPYGLNGITLLDFPNELAFRIGVADQCLCSAQPEEPIASGQTMKAWAWFAPPATSTGPFAVRFGSTYPVMDVPLQ